MTPNFFKNKKAVSLLMAITYGIVLFSVASLLISLLISSQKYIGLSERFNMAFYAAESGIEQGIFEINLHDVGFTDSTFSFTGETVFGNSVDSNGYIPISTLGHLKYFWSVDGKTTSDISGYLVYNKNTSEIPSSNSDKNYYGDFFKLFLYYDNSKIGSNQTGILVNDCRSNNYDLYVDFSTTSTGYVMDNDRAIIYWNASAFLADSSTGFTLEPKNQCTQPRENFDPYCYTNSDSFSGSGRLYLDDIHNQGFCIDDIGEACTTSKKTISTFFQDISLGDPKQPTLSVHYISPLYSVSDAGYQYPIPYTIRNNSSCTIPKLTIDLESYGQVYGSMQKISAKINQSQKGVVLDYALVQ